MSEKQRTLSKSVHITGIGLHTGEKVDIEICPADENFGYKFQRIDLDNQPIVKADVDLVVSTDRGTTLEKNGTRIYTTEHILAALYGCQVDNALIKMNGPEVPIMDGSAKPFVDAILKTGFTDQDAERVLHTICDAALKAGGMQLFPIVNQLVNSIKDKAE